MEPFACYKRQIDYFLFRAKKKTMLAITLAAPYSNATWMADVKLVYACVSQGQLVRDK